MFTFSRRLFKPLRFFTLFVIFSFLNMSLAVAETITIPAGTRIYVELDQEVVGKKKRTSVGQIVRAFVWRDVIVDNHTVISAGTPVLVRVDSMKGAKVAGIKGKITLGAYETTLVDNRTVQLDGGYFKKGKGRMALSASLAAFVFLPLIFIKGKAARLPRGMVFDAYIDRATEVDVPGPEKPVRSIDLSSYSEEGLYVEILYDELKAVEKPEVFPFDIQAPSGNSGEFQIDTINGRSIKPIPLEASQTGTKGELEFWRGEVEIKKLVKKLKKGINTFEISTVIDGQRVAYEIVLDIQI